MYRTDQVIWNQIAHEQDLYSGWASRMFILTEEQRDQELKKIRKGLALLGVDDMAISAYFLVLPLLLENEAISRFIMDQENWGLRATLPEVIDVEEAVELMSQEFLLADVPKVHLKQLLNLALIHESSGNKQEY